MNNGEAAESYVPGEIIVMFAESVTAGEALIFLRTRGLQMSVCIELILTIAVVRGVPEGTEDAVCERLNKSDLVEIAKRSPRQSIDP